MVGHSDEMEESRSKVSSRLFRFVEVLGVVTDGTRISVYKLGDETFILTSLGRSYYVMNLDKLRIILRSRVFPDTITSLYGSNENVYVAFDKSREIHIYHGSNSLGSLKGHQYKVKGLFTLGTFLISWSEQEIFVWDLTTLQLYGVLQRPDGATDRRVVSCVLHPETYVNKILVSYSSTSDVELWNFSTLKLIHTFRNVPSCVGDPPAISTMCISTHPDVVALGCSNGKVLLLDIKMDEILAEFENSKAAGSVISLACRQDQQSSKFGIFLCGCANGDLTIWNAYERRLDGIVNAIHSPPQGVTCLAPVIDEPLFVSCGSDNSIIVWIFDSVDNMPRELRSRKGLRVPISTLDFYDPNGKELLCIGNDERCTFGLICAFQQHQNCVFQQGKALKTITQKWRRQISFLPPLVSMSFCYARHFDWPNIVSAHKGLSSVFLWSGHDKTLIPRTIDLPVDYRKSLPTSVEATAVSISLCGHYVVVGYKQGHMHKFNLQSSTYRGEFRFHNQQAHNGRVEQIQIITGSTVLSCSTLVECCIRRWDLRRCVWLSDISLNPFVLKQSSNAIRFRTFQQLIVILLSTTPCSVTGQAPANHDITDGIYEKLVVFNSETGVLVRELPALLEDTIKTFEVTRDGRLVVYSTKKSPHLFVYDIVSSSLIDWIAFESPVSSIAFDPSNAFMYVGLEHLSGGLLVLGNHHVFELSQSSAVLKPTPKEPIYITQHVDSTTVSNKNNKNVDKPDKEDQDDLFFTSTASLEKYRLTLSGMSHQRLEAIVHLDAIKQRNAGTENVQKNMVSDLPFFLPTMYEGKELKFVSSTPKETLASEHNKKLKGSSSNLLKDTKSELQQLLLAMHHNNTESKRRAITSYFSTLSPSGIDLTLLQLGSLAGSTDAELVWMLDYFIDCIYSREQADLIQALLAVFLNKHSLSILDILQGQNNTDICDSDTSAQRETLTQQLKGRLERMRELIKQDWEPLELQCHQATTFLKFLTHTQIE